MKILHLKVRESTGWECTEGLEQFAGGEVQLQPLVISDVFQFLFSRVHHGARQLLFHLQQHLNLNANIRFYTLYSTVFYKSF